MSISQSHLCATPPDADAGNRKRESLSHLIYHMSEDDAVAQLISFNFAGFVDDVEECLAFKARNMDPRIQPNYARILYSWYTMRGDYRNGLVAYCVPLHN